MLQLPQEFTQQVPLAVIPGMHIMTSLCACDHTSLVYHEGSKCLLRQLNQITLVDELVVAAWSQFLSWSSPSCPSHSLAVTQATGFQGAEGICHIAEALS